MKPFVGIYRGIIRNQVLRGGAVDGFRNHPLYVIQTAHRPRPSGAGPAILCRAPGGGIGQVVQDPILLAQRGLIPRLGTANLFECRLPKPNQTNQPPHYRGGGGGCKDLCIYGRVPLSLNGSGVPFGLPCSTNTNQLPCKKDTNTHPCLPCSTNTNQLPCKKDTHTHTTKGRTKNEPHPEISAQNSLYPIYPAAQGGTA